MLSRNVGSQNKKACSNCPFAGNVRQFDHNQVTREMPMTTAFFEAADWLAEHMDDPEIQIIDARMAPPGQEHRDMAGQLSPARNAGGPVFVL